MKTDSPRKHVGSDGVERFWAWTHRMPRVLDGVPRDKVPTWHAFANEKECVKFVCLVDGYAKTSGEVGFGIPPKIVIDDWNYEEHYEPWE